MDNTQRIEMIKRHRELTGCSLYDAKNHVDYITGHGATISEIAKELRDSLAEITPTMPPVDAPCHKDIVPQEKCSHCSRVRRAKLALARAEGCRLIA